MAKRGMYVKSGREKEGMRGDSKEREEIVDADEEYGMKERQEEEVESTRGEKGDQQQRKEIGRT